MMLTDRCKLKLHFETKELPVYDLVVAKGGWLGEQNSKGSTGDDPPSTCLLETAAARDLHKARDFADTSLV
jgi:uncharacterized protein (TIGR03435 family)